MKLYRKGKIDYRDRRSIGKRSIAGKFKVRTKSDLGNASWSSDLILILAATAKLDFQVMGSWLGKSRQLGRDGKA